MDKFMILVSAVGIICVLAALISYGMAAATEGQWGYALCFLAAFALILFLLLAGWEYQDSFWEGK